uniref:Uncharacterized protein n=1 Tax=viral metagenome TaxID=1070528 RepID=A0A6C0HXC4_9ZZZZ
MLNLFIYTSVLHLTIACYKLISFYVLTENKNDYINSYNIYNNYDQLKLLIKTTTRLVLHKELLFRIYLVEFMKLILNEDDIIISWVIIFSVFNIYYHKYSDNIIITSNFIKTAIISIYLINTTILGSVFIHLYSELSGIVIHKMLFKYFIINNINSFKSNNIIKHNDVDHVNNTTSFKSIGELELVSKADVENLLSNKKID